MEAEVIIAAFVTMLVVIDPIGLPPMFVALTKGSTPAFRRAVALRACTIALILLTLFGLFGEALLGFIGISMPAFRVAGGILLFLTALDMLFDRRAERRKGQTPNAEDPSVFPLATPLIAGPGSITTMILLVGQADDWTGILAVHLVMAATVLLALVFFMAAGLFERALGATGINVVTRLLGMLLAALSVQFVLDGLTSFGIATGLG